MVPRPPQHDSADPSESTALKPAAPALIGHYRIEGELGRGGMGVVYVARDPSLDRRVAIKVLPAELTGGPGLERFEREARAAASLNHPNIATIHELGRDGQTRFIAMELVEGRRLHDVLAGSQALPLDLDEVLRLAEQIADGLAAAHDRQIVHRDLKPRNVIVTPEGRAKILDFGLAKVIEPASGPQQSTQLTAARTVVGTPGYMSPEQVVGGAVDARCDIFAFGILLYEMVTGSRPFAGDSHAALAAAVLRDTPAPPRELRAEVTAELEAVIDRCLAKDMQQRYPSARQLLADLRRARASVGRPRQEAPSIAVLPFANLSADAENEYFTDGMAEEIITALTKVAALRVTSRTSTFAFKGRQVDIRRIGEQLGVQSVLEGSVRKAGQRLRITAQLINVADGYHLWSERYDRDLEDVFAIQDEIAESIARALHVVLTEKEKQQIGKVPTTDIRAYDYYLRGRQYFRLQRKSLEFALQMFRRAIEIDPGYARAWAGVADTCSLVYMWWDRRREIIDQALQASSRAIELDPELAEAHVGRGLAVWLGQSGGFDEARTHFETAMGLDPKSPDAHYFYARACFGQGLHEEAIRLFEHATRVHPEDYQSAALVALPYSALNRHDEALAATKRALDVLRRHIELNPDDSRAIYLGANAWARIGEPQRALEWARRALDLDPEEPTVLYAVACVHVHLDDTDAALDLMEKAVNLGYGFREWWDRDPDLDPIRDHPRYQALLERM